MKRNLEAILKHTRQVGDCHEWIKCFNTDGYPRANINGDCNIKIHRVVWELHNNADATGKVVRHTCDNPKCINPAHLIIGTASENMLDRDLRGRTYRKVTPKVIAWVKKFLELPGMKQKEIAYLMDMNPRRVSDINCGRYSDDGKFFPRQKL